jgi:pimeloyl-ACP methyl ester carboxylesterase
MRSWQDDLGHYEFHRGYGSQEDEVNVFIHGLGFDMTTWDPLWEILDRQSSWLRYNLYGHGGRDYQPFDNPYIHAIDLANLLDMLHITTVHIIGHGLGGNMGLLFATMYPQRVRSLTTLSAHLFLYESVREDMLAYRRNFSSSDTLTPLAEFMAPLICQHKNHHSNIIAAYA